MKLFQLKTILAVLFTAFGCAHSQPQIADVAIQNNPEPSLVQKKRLHKCEKNLSDWNELQGRFGDSYEFNVEKPDPRPNCEPCVKSVTRIRVVEGKVVEREYTKVLLKTSDHTVMETILESWTENFDQIGTHQAGFHPQTIQEIRTQCDRQMLQALAN